MERTKIFLDTEFTGLHKNTTLISIGLVSECGKTFYAEFNDYNYAQVDDWIEDNVLNNLLYKGIYQILEGTKQNVSYKSGKPNIKEKLEEWLAQFKEVEIWSDCLAYDWVLFCDIFGNAFNIPENIYYIPFDICTSFKELGIDPNIGREEFVDHNIQLDTFEHLVAVIKHNALWDAYVIRECYKKLDEKRKL